MRNAMPAKAEIEFGQRLARSYCLAGGAKPEKCTSKAQRAPRISKPDLRLQALRSGGGNSLEILAS